MKIRKKDLIRIVEHYLFNDQMIESKVYLLESQGHWENIKLRLGSIIDASLDASSIIIPDASGQRLASRIASDSYKSSEKEFSREEDAADPLSDEQSGLDELPFHDLYDIATQVRDQLFLVDQCKSSGNVYEQDKYFHCLAFYTSMNLFIDLLERDEFNKLITVPPSQFYDYMKVANIMRAIGGIKEFADVARNPKSNKELSFGDPSIVYPEWDDDVISNEAGIQLALKRVPEGRAADIIYRKLPTFKQVVDMKIRQKPKLTTEDVFSAWQDAIPHAWSPPFSDLYGNSPQECYDGDMKFCLPRFNIKATPDQRAAAWSAKGGVPDWATRLKGLLAVK